MATVKEAHLPKICVFLLLFMAGMSATSCETLRSFWKPKDDFVKTLNLPDWVLESSIKLRIFSDFPNTVNPEDAMPEDDIASFANQSRVLLAASPAAMRDIYKMAGCLDGSELVGIRGNKLTDSQEDIWYGLCKSGAQDTIVFKVFEMGNDDLYRLYEDELTKNWEESKKNMNSNPDKAVRLATRIVEHEPSHPGARRLLGSLYLKAGYCPGAIRNYRIYLRILPRTPEKSRIDDLIRKSCKESLIPKKQEPKEFSEDLPTIEESGN
ncbi:tetratricopeptide repeat protein [Leptospira semungkisensis]|uniref:Tetratricopeptide repeat protein n=2 Tax=Leptospira semungkisensis TaxID=2484985 RepID=A0A4R9G0X4_9LEPT|nr:tetratricopeptide repeat protein [Leptospira semungkisensis]TGK05032.1 tetratricopeptide repeat protein [Leptospira semungkisensis]